MGTYRRGEFLGLSGVLAVGASLGGWWDDGGRRSGRTEESGRPLDAVDPDLVLLNGRVCTVDDGLPRAEAFAVKDGYFVAVGSSEDVGNLQGSGTEVIDAGGMTVTPGFIDTHCHPSGISELFDVWLADSGVTTIGELKQRLAAKAGETAPDYWVIGSGYDDTKVVDETTGRYRRINRWDLDEAVPDHAARVSHRGGHIAWYNSKALEMAGVTREVEDPPGGRFERDENGELTGLVEERAQRVFDGVGQREERTRADLQAGIAYISKLMAASGLTSVHQTGGAADSLVALQDAYVADEMRFRMYWFPRGATFEALRGAGIKTGFGDEWLRIGAVKFAADGSASGRTMAMSTPYVGRPDDHGILTMTQEEIHEAVEEAHRAGWQIGIHANGDVAIDMVLNAYERVQREWPREDPRHRLEHCSLVNPDLLRRIKAGDYLPTPFWTYTHYHGEKWAEYGQEKMEWMFAHRSFLDYDIPVPGASDYVPGPFEPLMAIQSMVTRRDMNGRVWGPNQRVTVDEALRIGTIHGAHASFEEDVKGSITMGKYADFVVLAEDPHEVEPDRIKEIEVVRTVVGGNTVHPDPAA